jgi:hypothetical protein
MMLRKTLPILVVALLAPTLGGCFLSANAPRLDAGAPSRVPRECQRILKKVPDPGAKEGEDLGDIAARYKGAYEKANHRIGAGRACEDHQADAIERGAK